MHISSLATIESTGAAADEILELRINATVITARGNKDLSMARLIAVR
jgi:hypothetical protein